MNRPISDVQHVQGFNSSYWNLINGKWLLRNTLCLSKEGIFGWPCANANISTSSIAYMSASELTLPYKFHASSNSRVSSHLVLPVSMSTKDKKLLYLGWPLNAALAYLRNETAGYDYEVECDLWTIFHQRILTFN